MCAIRVPGNLLCGHAGFIRAMRSNLGMANALADYENDWKSWRELFNELDRINAVTVDDVQRLRDCGLDDATIFDIAATTAGRAFFTKVLDAVGSLPDAAFSRIDDDLRVPLTVGRPIASGDDEVMTGLSD